MSKRAGMWLLSALLVVISLVVVFFAYTGGSKKFEFTTAEAQTLLNASLEKRALNEKSINIESATIIFSNNAVIIDATANGKIRNRTVRADVHAVGKPDYRNGSFYFVPTERPRFNNVKVEKTEKKPGMFDRTKEKLKQKVEELLAKHEWDDLTETFKADFKEWTLNFAEKEVERQLTKRPIYTAKDDLKGFVIKASVEKVEVVGDRIVVTVSVMQILHTIFIALVMLVSVIAIVVFLVMNPEFGITLALLSSIDI